MSKPEYVSVKATNAGRMIRGLKHETHLKVRLAGERVHLKVLPHPSSRLVFVFHGAVARDRKRIPQFADVFGVDATVVGVADPTLNLAPDLSVGWYAGHQGYPAQTHLTELFLEIQQALCATRPVFVGGSSGGFAALYFSHRIEGSVAVAVNPQTSIDRYMARWRQHYIGTCWPNLEDRQLSDVVVSDLCSLYAQSFSNSIVYLQNCADFAHVRDHMAPFIASLPTKLLRRVALRVGFWGITGHSASIPKSAWTPWVRAALHAKTATLVEMLKYPDLEAQSLAAAAPPVAPGLDPDDCRYARQLVAWLNSGA